MAWEEAGQRQGEGFRAGFIVQRISVDIYMPKIIKSGWDNY